MKGEIKAIQQSVYSGALLHLSCCPFAAADPDVPWEQPMPCLLQTTNPEHPGATAERQNEEGSGIRPLVASYSLAQWATQAELAGMLASPLLPIDLVSFKCPLVAVALPGGHIPVAQLEQMKHFAWICKASPESTCVENTQCLMKTPSSPTSSGAVHEVESNRSASLSREPVWEGTGMPVVVDAEQALLVFAQDAVLF